MQQAMNSKHALTPSKIISVTVKWNVDEVAGREMDETGTS
jgi:hypothetical protein